MVSVKQEEDVGDIEDEVADVVMVEGTSEAVTLVVDKIKLVYFIYSDVGV